MACRPTRRPRSTSRSSSSITTSSNRAPVRLPSPKMDEERQLAEHLHKAGELLKGGQLEGADKEIDAALALRRDDVRARNLRGLWLFRGAKYEEAEKIYLDLCSKWPDDAALRLNLGLVELRMAKF